MSNHDRVSSPNARLSERIDRLRQQHFVGRKSELALFQAALQEPEPQFAILYLCGPGGIGKSTMLREIKKLAQQAGAEATLIDCRNIDPTPTGFIAALCTASGVDTQADLSATLAAFPRFVLLLDTFEAISPLEPWLQRHFLPTLPERSLSVLAGQAMPSAAWMSDPGWRTLLRVVALRNLRPEESLAYLKARGVPQQYHTEALAFTHGHPLALSLVTEVIDQESHNAPGRLNLEAQPDVIRFLLDRFIQNVPSPLYRRALEICAHTRVTTEALLAANLQIEDAYPYFEWLRQLSFIEQGRQGLFPHDLARDVLDLDLRWRNPDKYLDMHKRLRNYIIRRFVEAQGREQQSVFFDLLFFHRNNPLMKPYYDWEALGTLYAEVAQPDDHPLIIETIRKFEGEKPAQIVAFWLERQPHAFWVFRSAAEQMHGFYSGLSLATPSDEELAADPGIRQAWQVIQQLGPLRPGEVFVYHRFMADIHAHHGHSASQNMFANISMRYWFSTPNLSWSLISPTNPDYWRPNFTYLNMRYSPEANFTVGEQSYGVFMHDWRAEPPVAWLEVMKSRELVDDINWQDLEASPRNHLLALSQPEFEEAVRQALRDLHRPTALVANPLMRSRLVLDHAGQNASPAALQELIQQTAEALQHLPKEEKYYRAVALTYLQPAPTQEIAAERLGLPFSTYRYHLAAGVERITERLWQRELYGSANNTHPQKI